VKAQVPLKIRSFNHLPWLKEREVQEDKEEDLTKRELLKTRTTNKITNLKTNQKANKKHNKFK